MKRALADSRGFSLLEVLVSTVILVIITLIMSTIFQQSSISWESGTQKANGNMMGRSLLGMISREMRGTIPHPENSFGGGMRKVTFVTLSPVPAFGMRAMEKIEYSYGSELSRQSWHLPVGAVSNGWVPKTELTKIATNLSGADWIVEPFCANGVDTVPDYVVIGFKLKKASNVSGVNAASAGPNGVFQPEDDPKDDDIRSY